MNMNPSITIPSTNVSHLNNLISFATKSHNNPVIIGEKTRWYLLPMVK